MQPQLDNAQINSDLMPHRAVMIVMALNLAAAVALCLLQGEAWQAHLPEPSRVTYRSLFYALAIATFPLARLIRYVQIRLCQTMPGPATAKRRYFSPVIVSMAMVESIGIWGLVMFLLGDGVNTLAIFSGLAALGFILYRPKPSEYESIVAALAHRDEANPSSLR